MRINLAIAAALALGLASIDGWAQQKIATINLKSVFDGYYKTKQSDATVKDRQADFEKDRKRMEEDYKKANEEFRKLNESALDPAVSGEEKESRKKLAESKLLELREIEQSVRQFDQQFRSQITDQIQRMRDRILVEIREVVNSHAKKGGFSMVIDTAAESANRTPIVLYTFGVDDLSEQVLTELNLSAPPGALTGSEEKK